MKILVVDDEPVVRDLTVEILRRSGYEPHGVDSARVALDLLARDTYDLVVTDVVMPEMTGIELLDQLRARGDEVPVLLMTGGSQEHERTSNALRLGASGLLYKPFSRAELTAAVERAARG